MSSASHTGSVHTRLLRRGPPRSALPVEYLRILELGKLRGSNKAAVKARTDVSRNVWAPVVACKLRDSADIARTNRGRYACLWNHVLANCHQARPPRQVHQRLLGIVKGIGILWQPHNRNSKVVTHGMTVGKKPRLDLAHRNSKSHPSCWPRKQGTGQPNCALIGIEIPDDEPRCITGRPVIAYDVRVDKVAAGLTEDVEDLAATRIKDSTDNGNIAWPFDDDGD